MSPAPRGPLRRTGSALTAGLALALVTATPAVAAPPTWTVQFNDRVAKAPDDVLPDEVYFAPRSREFELGDARPTARLVRGGALIAAEPPQYATDAYGQLQLPDLRVGDTLQVIDAVTGALYAQSTYAGLPSLDATTCTGSTVASGLRAPGATVDAIGQYLQLDPASYDPSDAGAIAGYVTALAGDGFSGSFAAPLVAGGYVYATSTQLATAQTPETSTYVERLVTACPGARPPAPPGPGSGLPGQEPTGGTRDTAAPSGTRRAVGRQRGIALRSLTARGLTFQLTSNEPAQARATLWLERRGHTGRATAIGASRATIGAAAARITVKPSRAGQRALRTALRREGTRLKVVITLADPAGNLTTLPPVWIAHPRP